MFDAPSQVAGLARGQVRETPERLLDAAGEVFAERGFRDATIREICGKAGANVAAVNYHFGGKDQLYVEVLRYADKLASDRHPPIPEGFHELPPEQRLAVFVRQFLRRVFDTGRPAWMDRLMAREMSEPTGALEGLMERNIRPRAVALQQAVRELLGPKADEATVHRVAGSVVGQCLFYHHCRPMIGKLMPMVPFDASGVETLSEHITRLTMGGIRELRVAIEGGEMGTPSPNGDAGGTP